MLRSLQPYLSPAGGGLLVGARAGDDGAVWRSPSGAVVGTVDTMVEGVDFRLDWPGLTFRTLGRRLMSINLSDLAAMAAEPRHALISLCLPGRLAVADVTDLYRGIAERAKQYGCTVAGGDLSATDGPLVLTAALYGAIPRGRRLLRRTGARPGWQIAVTGSLGAAAAGLRLLESGRPPATRAERAWVTAQLDPTPQLAAGQALAAAGIRVGGDISDGLYREVERLVQPARLGASIAIDRLPLADGLRKNQWALAVTDSEDFQLICAAPAARIASATRALDRLGLSLTIVGTIDARRGIRLIDGARLVRFKGAGYDHFR